MLAVNARGRRCARRRQGQKPVEIASQFPQQSQLAGGWIAKTAARSHFGDFRQPCQSTLARPGQ